MRLSLCLLLALSSAKLHAQAQMVPPPHLSAGEALAHALNTNVLTFHGSPFHAVMETASADGSDPAYKARIELFWKDEKTYRLTVDSPAFRQTLVTNNGAVMELDHGDFYPTWLQSFVQALLDPIPHAQELLQQQQRVEVGAQTDFSCVGYTPGNVARQVDFAQVCFGGEDAQLAFAVNFTYSMRFGTFKSFKSSGNSEAKQIARAYLAGMGDQQPLLGNLATLEPWVPDAALFAVPTPTPTAERILTATLPLAQVDAMLQPASKDAMKEVAWPTVREGSTDGVIAMRVTTDRSGQVREAYLQSTENPALADFARTLALQYKFKPLLVDGAARQIATALLLHFKTSIANPISELDDATSRKLISGCTLPHELADPSSAGKQIELQIQVDDDGSLITLATSDRRIPAQTLEQQLRGCTFAVYKQNGKPTAYHLNLNVTAK